MAVTCGVGLNNAMASGINALGEVHGGAGEQGTVRGRHLAAALAVEQALEAGRTRPVPMNIDGATATIDGELGCPPPLARGLFVLSRSVGILAHAWEESRSGRRNKGPMPPSILPARAPTSPDPR